MFKALAKCIVNISFGMISLLLHSHVIGILEQKGNQFWKNRVILTVNVKVSENWKYQVTVLLGCIVCSVRVVCETATQSTSSYLWKLKKKNFYKYISWEIQRISNFPARILIAGEGTFNKFGMINIRNEHFWARENPHAFRNSSCKMLHHLILSKQCNSLVRLLWKQVDKLKRTCALACLVLRFKSFRLLLLLVTKTIAVRVSFCCGHSRRQRIRRRKR